MFWNGEIRNKKILLHACCGPCSLGAVQPLLNDGANITLFYYNPCIIDGEYEKRLSALSTVAAHYGLPLILGDHDRSEFLAFATEYAVEREGGRRCSLCIGERLEQTARYAAEHGFDMYSTTLTVSPHKNSKAIFELAEKIDHGAPFLPRDFKKRDGFLRSTRLSAELGIYRQTFCGCEFSKGGLFGDRA